MPTATAADRPVTDSWSELTAADAGLASANVSLQNVGTTPVAVVFGGAAAPVGKSGTLLSHLDSVAGNAANIWARSIGASSVLSVQVTS